MGLRQLTLKVPPSHFVVSFGLSVLLSATVFGGNPNIGVAEDSAECTPQQNQADQADFAQMIAKVKQTDDLHRQIEIVETFVHNHPICQTSHDASSLIDQMKAKQRVRTFLQCPHGVEGFNVWFLSGFVNDHCLIIKLTLRQRVERNMALMAADMLGFTAPQLVAVIFAHPVEQYRPLFHVSESSIGTEWTFLPTLVVRVLGTYQYTGLDGFEQLVPRVQLKLICPLGVQADNPYPRFYPNLDNLDIGLYSSLDKDCSKDK